jgi:hypothetical protein
MQPPAFRLRDSAFLVMGEVGDEADEGFGLFLLRDVAAIF